jgi:enoyl-CoA hydratase/carnithine racemase
LSEGKPIFFILQQYSKEQKMSITTVIEGFNATLTIDNAPINLLTAGIIGAIKGQFEQLSQREDLKTIVVRSASDRFFAGHLDVRLLDQTHADECRVFSDMIKTIRNCPQLTIAVVEGVARGGGNELAMACDLIYATENAVFALPEINMNIPTGGRGAVHYLRRMGRTQALEALLLGYDYSAAEAFRAGMITRVVPSEAMNAVLGEALAVLGTRQLADTVMYKEILDATAISDEAGAECELRHFKERAAHPVTQATIKAFLECGGQTEREVADLEGLLADTAEKVMASKGG